MRRLPILAILLLVSCSGTSDRAFAPARSPAAAGPADGDPPPTRGGPIAATATTISTSATDTPIGLPHRVPIETVALSFEGDAALTADVSGSVRLWPSLDGSREPQPVKLRAPLRLRLARRSEPITGFTLAAVDAAGGVLLHSDPAGVSEELTRLRGTSPLRALEVLPGGELVAALFDDHRVVLYDLAGGVLGELRQRKLRPIMLSATSDPTLLIAVSRDADRGGTEITFTAHRVRIGAENAGSKSSRYRRELTVDGAVSWTVPENALLPTGEPAISADGKRAASLTMPPAAAGINKAQLIAVDLVSGTATTLAAALYVTPPLLVGFSDDHEIVAGSLTGGTWRFDIDANQASAGSLAMNPVTGGSSAQVAISDHAFARGRRVVGYDESLYVEDLAENRRYFIGYGGFGATNGSFSPDGSSVAWVNFDGEIVIDRLDHTALARRIAPMPDGGFPLEVALLDPTHVATLTNGGTLRVIDALAGTVLSETALAQEISAADAVPALGVLAYVSGRQPQVVEVSADGTVRGPYLIFDGSQQMGVMSAATSASAPLLWTIDSAAQLLRIYTLDELRAGVSVDDVSSNSRPLPAQQYAYAVSADGTVWIASQTAVGTMERWRNGAVVDRHSYPDLAHVWVAPDERTVTISTNSSAFIAYDTATDRKKWSRAFAMSSRPRWSPDGKRLAISLPGAGGAVLDAATGATIFERCGLAFGRSDDPPVIRNSGIADVVDVCQP